MDSQRPISLGIIGTGRIAGKFIDEIRALEDLNLLGVFNPHIESAEKFCREHKLFHAFKSLEDLFESVEAVYIASPHHTHYEYARQALEHGIHVLCEKPLVVLPDEVGVLYSLARDKGLTLLEGIKTAYYPGFIEFERIIESGRIGEVVDVEASFTKLVASDVPEMSSKQGGGSVLWLASYPLYAIGRLLGADFLDASFFTRRDENGIDVFTRGVLKYDGRSASFKVGLGAKTDGCLVVTGTQGFAVVPAPWWNTKDFWLGFEDPNVKEEYSYELKGYGLRYEIAEFARLIRQNETVSERMTQADSEFIAKVMSMFLAST